MINFYILSYFCISFVCYFLFQIMSVSEYRYQTIREREGKTKKITQKEFVLSIGHGQYYPPEGVAVFQEDNSPVVYFMGGARHKKPAHWAMSNYMFRVTLEKLEDEFVKNYTEHFLQNFLSLFSVKW